LIILLLFYSVFTATAAQIDTLIADSKSMHKQVLNLVIIPDSYQTQKEPYDVLYLLHGAGGDYTSWLKRVPAITTYADQFNIIIVCPNGGKTSWYFDSPIDSAMRYETYMSSELISAVDKKYRTVNDKSGRAITGLSMGGHGAFYLSFKHPDIWGAAGSMSGGLDIRPFPANWDLAKRLGNYTESKEVWDEHTVINMVYLLANVDVHLIFDCGVDDFFLQVNRNLHQKLLANDIPHDYSERPGGHTWNYWANAIKYQLLFFQDYFNL
jgi:S-formylglutathione hydrolase FrmB